MSLETPPLRRASARTLDLVPLSGQAGGQFPPTGTVLVGSQLDCEVAVGLPSVSHRHALFACHPDGRWWVYDLHSRRGVTVNGKPVKSKAVATGDVVEVGDVRWRIEVAGGKKAARPADPLSDFKLLQKVHSGKNGTLYRALWKAKKREVAVRVFPSSVAADPGFVARFKERLPLAAGVRHDNVVRLYRGGRFRDRKGRKRWFLATDYLVGGSLRDRLKNRAKPLAVSDVLTLALDIGSGLWAAAEAGLRHRNLTPTCILFDGGGRAKLGDFLHARPEGRAPGEATRADLPFAELAYHSPEQVRGAKDLDPSADLYALAACLYEALTLRPPFDPVRGAVGLVMAVREEVPVPIRERNPDVPEKFEALLMECLEKDPSRRPADADEFLKRLAKVR